MKTEALKNKASSPPKEWTPLELAEMKTGKYLGPIHRPKGFAPVQGRLQSPPAKSKFLAVSQSVRALVVCGCKVAKNLAAFNPPQGAI
jgi:hypothetical protein